jgi:5-oxoprolinase (ATP-hydrolysing) subunit A
VSFVPYGDQAFIAPRPEGVSPRALLEALRAVPGVLDVVITEDEICVYGEAHDLDLALAGVGEAPPPREHVIEVIYDGEDLAPGMAELHTSRIYTVAMMGFLPGFAYLTGLDPRLVVPRRQSPRTRVPAGSVAIAGPYTGIYPFASPGGWNLIGRAVNVELFSPERGALFALGDRVRFEAR